MASLKYKTRGNSNPQGKSRVYFCCHKDDFDMYFESVSNELLSMQNCVIWYKDSNDHANEELLDDLKGMQLFVMPVTANLLCTENDALDIEFKLAIEKHIPVLPLMQEPGLEQIFNQKCGDLQFLDKHNTDITAISYEEKLKKYLESVLIGDEMAEKIRAAFDAYVFLSYRKKDRKYAQELMHLIHKNEFCRDIAIWYDEFLTPGENFNDSIKEALQKSGLFVLTVTPNLVNEVNYIMTTEYPMAKQEGKPILPAELVPTNREELSRKYEDIPAVSDAHNDSELSDALLESIKKMAIKGNDKNPEHNFFIGLAYLGGVDVEVDHGKALSLITSAADAGLPDAMEKLVDMYRNGLGIKRDYLKAIEWQEKLVNYYTEIYKNNKLELIAKSLITNYWKLGDFYFELQSFEKADEAFEKIEFFCVNEQPDAFDRQLMASYERRGRIAEKRNDFNSADTYQKKAFDISVKLADSLHTVSAYQNVAMSFDRLGDVAVSKSDLPTAKHYYNESLKILLQIMEQSESDDILLQLSDCYYNLSKVERLMGSLPSARDFLEKCLAIRENLFKTSDSLIPLRKLSLVYVAMGQLYSEENNYDMARKYYLKSLNIDSETHANEDTIQSIEDLDTVNTLLGDISADCRDFKTAKEYYLNSLHFVEKLIEKVGNLSCYRRLAVCYMNLGVASRGTEEFDLSLKCYTEAISLFEQLAKATNTLYAYEDLALAYYARAGLTNDKDFYVKAHEIFSRLSELSPDTRRFVQYKQIVENALEKFG